MKRVSEQQDRFDNNSNYCRHHSYHHWKKKSLVHLRNSFSSNLNSVSGTLCSPWPQWERHRSVIISKLTCDSWTQKQGTASFRTKSISSATLDWRSHLGRSADCDSRTSRVARQIKKAAWSTEKKQRQTPETESVRGRIDRIRQELSTVASSGPRRESRVARRSADRWWLMVAICPASPICSEGASVLQRILSSNKLTPS